MPLVTVPSATELLLENSVFLAEKIDHCVLLAADPAGERGHENLPRLENRRHPQIVAKPMSDRQLRSDEASG